eukprot:236158-Ditylum_brightwellii.AAC.1
MACMSLALVAWVMVLGSVAVSGCSLLMAAAASAYVGSVALTVTSQAASMVVTGGTLPVHQISQTKAMVLPLWARGWAG